MLKSIRNVLCALEENQIAYCHWKSNEHLQDALNGNTDLDLLFSPIDRTALEVQLNCCGMKRFRAMPLMQYNGIEDYIGFDKETCKIWHLHLHYRLTLGEKHLKGYTLTPFADYILKNRIKTDWGIYISAPEIEYVMLLVRMALKLRLRDWFKKVSRNDVAEMKWLIDQSDKDAFERHAHVMLKDENSVGKLLALYGHIITQKNQLRSLRRAILQTMKPFTGNNLLESRFRRTIRELFWGVGGVSRRLLLNPTVPYRRVSPSGGTVVAFVGCDGAGKTTTLTYLLKEFQKKLDVRLFYMGSGDGHCSILRMPMRYVAKRVGGKGLGRSVAIEYSTKKNVSLKAKLYMLAKLLWAMALAREKKKKLREITKARNRGMLVFTDRYPQSVSPGCNDGPLLTKYIGKSNRLYRAIAQWELRIYQASTLNPPDLIVKLTVPTEIALQRKPEMTAEEIEEKKSIVSAMNFAPSIEVNTSLDINETMGIIMENIWKII